MHPKVLMLINVLPLVNTLLLLLTIENSQCFIFNKGCVRQRQRHRHWPHITSKSSTASEFDCDSTESNFILSRRQLFFLAAFTVSTSPALAATSNKGPVKISQTQIVPNNPEIRIPRIGYSLYKTDPDQVQRGINIALHAGVRHFDVASLYNTNDIVGDALFQYCNNGLPKLDPKGFVLSSSSTGSSSRTSTTGITSSIGFRNRRRNELFISHKIANEEQSTDIHTVKEHIHNQMVNNLKLSYLDMVMIHSPLTDAERRINTYKALVELKKDRAIRAIGVCHYSTSALDEIINVGLPPPDVIQLQLSPFNQHRDILSWAEKHNSIVSCSAWSRLSSVDGPQDGWAIVSKIAQSKQMTKAQVLIQWSLQNNFCCVPRSGVASKLERNAIYENSYKGMTDESKWKSYYLNEEEMNILNGLDEGLKVGKLGVVDGWKTNDIVDSKWDPTDIVFASTNQQHISSV